MSKKEEKILKTIKNKKRKKKKEKKEKKKWKKKGKKCQKAKRKSFVTQTDSKMCSVVIDVHSSHPLHSSKRRTKLTIRSYSIQKYTLWVILILQ